MDIECGILAGSWQEWPCGCQAALIQEINPIVDEVRRVRDAYAAQFNYDLDAIFQDVKEQDRKSKRTFVAPSARSAHLPTPCPPAILDRDEDPPLNAGSSHASASLSRNDVH
jgi:hypothetical protein